MKRKILIVAAHPDDEVLGCGGTISRLVKEGYQAYTLILGEGKTARDNSRNPNKRKDEIIQLKEEALKANKIMGVKKVFISDFPDNRFDSVPLLDVVKAIENVKKKIKPDIIFTHYENDLNIDHRIVYQAVLIATRPMKTESVKEIYSFENASSTEWNFPLSFSPDIFFDISSNLRTKTQALRCYKSEIRKFPHPRSIEGIELLAKTWGMKLGKKYIEAFKCVREVK